MSLYSALFGTNPLAQIVLTALGTTEDEVPRFRDAYFDAQNDRLVIHTRTGGGNRPYYESEDRRRDEDPEAFEGDEPPTGPWNADLRLLPGFIYDRDDDFDSTYADFFFKVPAPFKPIFDGLKALGAGKDMSPAERWQTVLSALQSGASTPDTDRALKIGEAIMESLTALSTEGDGQDQGGKG
jgi:hypothetical protein